MANIITLTKISFKAINDIFDKYDIKYKYYCVGGSESLDDYQFRDHNKYFFIEPIVNRKEETIFFILKATGTVIENYDNYLESVNKYVNAMKEIEEIK